MPIIIFITICYLKYFDKMLYVRVAAAHLQLESMTEIKALSIKRQFYNARLPRGGFSLRDIIIGCPRLPTITAVPHGYEVLDDVSRPEEAISRNYLLVASRKIRNSKSNSERTTSLACLLRLASRWDNICERGGLEWAPRCNLGYGQSAIRDDPQKYNVNSQQDFLMRFREGRGRIHARVRSRNQI